MHRKYHIIQRLKLGTRVEHEIKCEKKPLCLLFRKSCSSKDLKERAHFTVLSFWMHVYIWIDTFCFLIFGSTKILITGGC